MFTLGIVGGLGPSPIQCVGCGCDLNITKYFCSYLCAETFSKGEDEALEEQQQEELSWIRTNCFGNK